MPLALALVAGALASVNPCGFPLYVGAEEEDLPRAPQSLSSILLRGFHPPDEDLNVRDQLILRDRSQNDGALLVTGLVAGDGTEESPAVIYEERLRQSFDAEVLRQALVEITHYRLPLPPSRSTPRLQRER